MRKHKVRLSVLGNPLCALVVVALGAACRYSQQQSWLSYTPSGATTGWTVDGDGRLAASLHGTSVTVDLSGRATRIEVSIQNTTGQSVEIRMGAEGTAGSLQIGELLQREIVAEPGTGPDYVPYNAMQAVRIESGWRASFYLDSPLGRPPSYGQYFVFTVEARRSGAVDRRSLPLVAKNPRHPSRRR